MRRFDTHTTTSRVLIGLLVVLGLFLALGGLAMATLPSDPPDFAPFTMRITVWNAAASQREGQAPQPGTADQILEYRSRYDWSLTVVGSTWDPRAVGTKTETKSGTHSTFVSQAQKLFSRVIPQEEAGREAPVPWIYPGTFDGLSRSSQYQRVSSPLGTATFVQPDSTTTTRADGTLAVVTGTLLVFDASSGLPLSVYKFRDSVLSESIKYEVLSRP